jgi:MYXO-CTERM domain-containing protein
MTPGGGSGGVLPWALLVVGSARFHRSLRQS